MEWVQRQRLVIFMRRWQPRAAQTPRYVQTKDVAFTVGDRKVNLCSCTQMTGSKMNACSSPKGSAVSGSFIANTEIKTASLGLPESETPAFDRFLMDSFSELQ